jgi:hypothetical protein
MAERQNIDKNVERQNVDKNFEDIKEDSTGPPSGQKYPRYQQINYLVLFEVEL